MRIRLLALCGLLVGTAVVPAGAGDVTQPGSIDAICRKGLESPCVTRVGASLRSERSGEPLSGRKLSFVSRDVVICSTLTNEAGSASCSGVAPSGVALSAEGYRVLFEGDGRYAAASVATRR